MIPVNYHHLYYFYRIAETGSISAACKELRLAQPTLSAQLMQLESFLGVRLFEREKRKLLLTEDGRLVLAYTHQIFDAGKELLDSLSDRSQRGRIRIQIGALDFIPKSFIEALIVFILKNFPQAQLSVHEGGIQKLSEDLDRHALDVVMTDDPIRSQRSAIESHLIGKIPIMFYASARLAKKYSGLPRGLHDAPMILPTAQSQVYRSLCDYFAQKKIFPRVIAEIEDVEVVRRLAVSGIAIAPLNVYSATRKHDRHSLVALAKKPIPELSYPIYLAVKKRVRVHPILPKVISDFRITI